MAVRRIEIHGAGHEGGLLEVVISTEEHGATGGVSLELSDGDTGRLYNAHLLPSGVNVLIAALRDARAEALDMVIETPPKRRANPFKLQMVNAADLIPKKRQ